MKDNPSNKESLDPVIKEHLDSLMSRNLQGGDLEKRYIDCIVRLKERFLRNLKRKQEEALAFEAETGDRAAVLAKLEELGIDSNEELKRIFNTGVGYKADLIQDSKNKRNTRNP